MMHIICVFIFYILFLHIENAESNCPAGWILSSTGQCYLYHPGTDLDWPSASTFCQQTYGAHLPIFLTSSEQLAYNNLMTSTGVAATEIHYLGVYLGSILGGGAAWMYVNNANLQYTNWYGGGGVSGNGNCSYMMGTFVNNQWNAYNCYIQSFSFCCQMNSTVTTFTCPLGWTLSDTYQCYNWFNITTDWVGANAYCSNAGFYLPIIRNEAEHEAYRKIAKAQFPPDGVFTYFGLSKVTGQWLFVDGTNTTYFYWYPFSPVPDLVTGRNCTYLWKQPSNFSFGDIPCNQIGATGDGFYCQKYPSSWPLGYYVPNTTTIATTIATTVVTTTMPLQYLCANGWLMSTTGQCYLYIDNVESFYLWKDALTYCQAYGATLPIFRSVTEQIAYNDLMISINISPSEIHMLGLSSTVDAADGQQGPWLWPDNTTAPFLNWNSGSPSGGEYCTYMDGLAYNNTWNDYGCTWNGQPLAFCCQMNTSVGVPAIFTDLNISMDFLADPMSLTTTVQDIGPFLISSLNASMKEKLGQPYSDLIQTCTYENNDCSNKSNFQFLYNPSYGNCYTFNFGDSPKYSVKDIGPDYGLRILLSASQGDYSCASQNAGFRVTFAENNAPVYPESEGYNIPLGTASTITLQQSTINRLGKPIYQCAESDYLSSEGKYTVEDCLRKCFQDYVIGQCHCADPRFPPTSNTDFCQLNKKTCLDYINNCMFEEATAQCDCPPPCKEVVFHPTTTSVTIHSTDVYKKAFCQNAYNTSVCENSFNENVAILYIYYRSLKSFEYNEVRTYDLWRLLSDFSGVTGLLLGVCVMTLPEVVLFLFKISTMCCSKSK